MSNKKTNDMIKEVSLKSGDQLGGSACRTCTKSFCCSFQHEVGIASSEFDTITHLVTEEQIARAKHEIERDDSIVLEDGLTTYRCPFLSEAGKCEIYDERFMICAIYSVVGDSYQCSLDNKEGIVQVVNPAEVIMNSAMLYPEVKARMMKHIAVDEVPSDVLVEFKRRYLNDK